MPCFRRSRKWASKGSSAKSGSMSVCMLYSLKGVDCVTLYPDLKDSTSRVPTPGIRASTTSGVAVTIL